ncbi:DUF4126 domain-containing protein [Mycobacterium shinjukuense]|uniref:Membrane protein n=1 Tax=Mycobacterium shinjukuense TaxID=398694 RepID=A0A7I7MLV3_9MYCO|nr:DUF4126 family protein [Mycobacterium shinjukuense]MCV6984856.1 DUF4126 domain-containing protein [Mycobacterium shinjukuense]ORB70427.1 DUF4126 domain-containing protein [Mycobacterium shinjukuense]BBX73241.1 membrane protein [Mycobacterium shinjukuense]
MTHVLVLLLALLIGVVAGLRSVTAPAVVCWAAFLGWINLHGTWAAWVGTAVAVGILTVLAVAELVHDKLPGTPARTATPAFAFRIITGGFAGAVVGTAWGYPWGGLGAGVVGAVLGTVGGYQARRWLVAKNGGRDLPIALLEDSVAVLGGFAIVATAAAL